MFSNGLDETYVRHIFTNVQRLADADVLCLMRYVEANERERGGGKKRRKKRNENDRRVTPVSQF